jgi:hypothetical protein
VRDPVDPVQGAGQLTEVGGEAEKADYSVHIQEQDGMTLVLRF